jgi:hypothetical protein
VDSGGIDREDVPEDERVTGRMRDMFGPLDLGDARREARLYHVVEQLAAQPDAGLPQACGDEAATTAAYRFFRNETIAPTAIRTSLAAATVVRCQAQARVLAIPDTTTLDYTHYPATTGLGMLDAPDRQGLIVHSTLAASVAGVPLGLLDQQVWVRDPAPTGKRQQREVVPIEGKESAKWLRGLLATEARRGPLVAVVHVADREADIDDLLALAAAAHGDYVLRARHDRRLDGTATLLRAQVAHAPVRATTAVEVHPHPGRPARLAQVVVRATTVTLTPPERPVGPLAAWWAAHAQVARLAPERLAPLGVGVVWVREVAPPAGAKPLDWLLLTSLPLATAAEVPTVVAYYRLRWLIERYHFVLTSGCRIEHRRLKTAARLERALAVYGAVAWWLLWLTYRARAEPTAPCTVALEGPTWQVLHLVRQPGVPLPATPPSLGAAVRQIAMLGGFLGRRGDGEPGGQTLWRGLMRLHDMVRAVRAVQDHLGFPLLE